MHNQGTSRSRHLNVIRNSVPHPVSGGVCLPGSGVEIRLVDNSIDQVWHLVHRNEYKKKLTAFETLLDGPTFDRTIVKEVLKQLYNDPDLPKVLFYGGFIIDWLYGFHQKKTDVQKKKTDAQSYDYAARLCYVLICFWQERSSHDDQALLALPMLWRSYWLALDQIHQAVENQRQQLPRDANADADLDQYVRRSHKHAWLSGWIGHTVTEQARALRAWQHVCLKDDPVHLRFFEELLCPWERRCTQAIPPDTWWQRLGRRIRQRIVGDDQGFCQFSAWQQLREREVNGLIWDSHQLRFADLKLAVERRRLRYFMTQWYLPRYDVCKAQRVQWELACAEHDGLALVGTPVLGLTRLYAAIGVGYAATVLQGDTWTILYDIIATPRIHIPGVPVWLAVLLSLICCTFVYLAGGIHRRTGTHALRRSLYIWISASVFATITGAILSWIVAPGILESDLDSPRLLTHILWSGTLRVSGGEWMVQVPVSCILVLVYAQLALFFGIFIQLVFDDRPATTMLDSP